MTLPPQNSLNLALRRLGYGDRTAAEEVFSGLWPPVLAFCMKMLRSTADAQDAAQGALEKVFAQCHTYDATRPALAWALAIANWECKTLLRRRGRRAEVPLDADPRVVDGDHPTSEETLMLEQARRAARDLMSELAPLEREALERAFAEEVQLSTTERKRKQRAIERLRAAWRRLYGA
jgi:RNA polymerase sigma-70 factor (ECF subfamily)